MAGLIERLSRFVSDSSSQTAEDTAGSKNSSLSPTLDEEQAIFNEAAAMERRTDLHFRECVILIGSREGFDDGEIGTMIGHNAGSVKRKKEALRDRRHQMEQQVAHELDALSNLERYD